MNEAELFRRLSESSRPPELDVSGGVIDAIRAAPVENRAQMVLLTALSSAVAAIVLAVALERWVAFADPLNSFFEDFVTVML